MKKVTLLKLLFLMSLPVANVFAQSVPNTRFVADKPAAEVQKPLDAFIRHVGETNTFVQVSNIWSADDQFDKTDLLQSVTKVQPLTIDYTAVADLIQKNTIAISLVVPGINGGTYTIDLAQYSPLHNDFKVYADAGNGHVTLTDYTPGKYYSGVVRGIPGSVAGFSFFKNEVYGMFSIPNVGNLVLVPNSLHGPAYNYTPNYILYNDADMRSLDKAPKCGVDQLDLRYLNGYKTASKTTTTVNNNVYQNCKEVNVLEVGDYSYFQSKGSNMANATNFLSAMFNNQATIYRNESVIINLKAVKINTATDIYKTLGGSSSTYLNAFGDDIQNTYSTTYGCNLAMLLTCTHNGSMGGVAWVSVLCQSYGGATSHVDATAISNIDSTASLTSPSFPTYSWNVEVLSHEMGHNVGSSHTHACVWNPVYTGTTAIDGCVAVTGGCATPVPAIPAGGGTIMSYCHLSSFINFSNGFGPQPGTVIRNYINSSAPGGQPNAPASCLTSYHPDSTLNTPNMTVAANRECTDLTTGYTYYWNDNNTANQKDDVLVLMIKKNGNTIGDLNTVGFSVSTNTIVRYGTGTGDTLVFPSGMPASILAQNYGMRRYWLIAPTSTPATAVEVVYPFLSVDTLDVHGSVVGLAPLSSYLMYKANTPPVDPNPYNGFVGSVASNFQLYTYGAAASTSVWSLTTVGTFGQTKLAHMMMTNLKGGGTGFYTYCNGLAAPTIVTSPPAPCPGATVVYSVTPDPLAVSYTWTVGGTGWSGTSTGPSITLTAGTGIGNIVVTANASCGAGYPTSFSLTPAPLPVVAITPTSGLCATDATAAFVASVTSGGPALTYTWTATGAGAWAPLGATTSSTFTATKGTGTGTITLRVTNVCGSSPVTTFLATMTNTAPSAPTSITPPALACPSSTGVFTTPSVAGATSYTWSVAGTGWSGFSSSNAITVNIGTGLGTLTVSASNTCGTSPAYSRGFTPSTGPGAATAINGPATPCSGTAATLVTPAVLTATSYNWVVTGTGWSGSSTTNTINVLVGSGLGTITVTPVNACGTGTPFTTTIVPAPAPTSTFDLSSHIVEAHTDVIALFTGSAPPGSTYTWSFPGGVGTPGTGSGPQTIHWNTAGQFLVFLTVNNGAGCSSATADTVQVNWATSLQNLNIQKINADIIPNPNNGTFEILFTEPINQPLSVKLFDVQGRAVYYDGFRNAANKSITVKTENLPSGTYIATIYLKDYVISRKIEIYK